MRQPGTIYSRAAEELFPHSVAGLVARRGLLHEPTMHRPALGAARCVIGRGDGSYRSEPSTHSGVLERERETVNPEAARERVGTVIPARRGSSIARPRRGRVAVLHVSVLRAPSPPAKIEKAKYIRNGPPVRTTNGRVPRGPTRRDAPAPQTVCAAAVRDVRCLALARAFSKRQRSSKSLRGAHATFASSSPHLPSCHLD